MLFAAVSASLTEFAANSRWLGGTGAFSLVLHTWQQDLGRHVHFHALVPGGALKADGVWVAAKRGFLFPIEALSEVFRGKFVAALKAARQGGKLRAEELRLSDATWGALLARLYEHDWVVDAKQSLAGPEQVLDYLGRYTHRVAISNERILGMAGDTVRLRVRDSAHGNRRRTLSVPAHTFIERFLLHVLPKGFKRIRHYGLLGPAGKTAKLAQARAALSAPAPDRLVVESLQAFMQRIDRLEWLRCPHCGTGQFVPTAPIAPALARVPPLRGPPLDSRCAPNSCAVLLALSPARGALGPSARFARYRHSLARVLGPLLPVLAVAIDSRYLIGRAHRHATRLNRAAARLQSP